MLSLFKPQRPFQWKWATLSGPDALDFLHRITTVNVRDLEIGQGAKGCILSAQGRFRAYFTLWRYGADEFGIEYDAGENGEWHTHLFTAIDQFTFAEKMTLTAVEGLESRWLFADAESAARLEKLLGPVASELKPGTTLAIEPGIRLCHQGTVDFERTWITVWGRAEQLDAWTQSLASPTAQVDSSIVEAWRISATRPRVGAEITDQAMPLELGLGDAIAQNKGCYPGQEVIEKVISLGSPAKRLAKIEGRGQAPAMGSTILNTAEPAAEVGTVTSSLQAGADYAALAIVRKIHAKEGLEVRLSGSNAPGRVIAVSPNA